MNDVIICANKKWFLTRNFSDEFPMWRKVRVELNDGKLIVVTYKKRKYILDVPKREYRYILENFLGKQL